MPLQNGLPARDNSTQDIQFFRRRMSFDGSVGLNAAAGAFILGRVRAGAIILPMLTGVDTLTVFNAATTNRFQIGVAGAVSRYGLNVTAATLGFAAVAVAIGHRVAVDTDILVTPDFTGTAATTGDVELILAFINPN